jgi:hypothetical protein
MSMTRLLMLDSSPDRQWLESRNLFLLVLSQTREEEMVFLDVLSTEKTFLSPEIAIGRMLIALNEEKRRWSYTLGMNELPSCGDWFLFTTFDAKLRNAF